MEVPNNRDRGHDHDHCQSYHLGELVRGTVEETLNAMLDAEADELCGAGRYQRSADRVDTRAGSYDRTLHTWAREVKRNRPVPLTVTHKLTAYSDPKLHSRSQGRRGERNHAKGRLFLVADRGDGRGSRRALRRP